LFETSYGREMSEAESTEQKTEGEGGESKKDVVESVL